MGSGTFFSKVASADPLAQALHLPGSDKYAQQQASSDAGTSAYGPYTGVTPTLAAANAGYRPGGPGAIQGYTAWSPSQQGGFFGDMQRFAQAASPYVAGGVTQAAGPNPASGANPFKGF